MNIEKGSYLKGRDVEFFRHGADAEWGYPENEVHNDSFAVIHPKNENKNEKYPLVVVVHSAGHDVFSTISCMIYEGNHDIYHTPEDTYALVLDCRENAGKGDWWWGGVEAHTKTPQGFDRKPVEKRVFAEIDWVMKNYPIDENRVYGVGNSMGGSGALGLGLCRGDLFAALKVNVPAGVRHAADRCCFDVPVPEGFTLPDPPIVVDYSAQNDEWSDGHEVLYKGMKDFRFPLMGFWGNYGHCNTNTTMDRYNDLIHSFDIFSVRKNEAYPVFTCASTDDPLPWPDNLSCEASGQVNAFFRWKVLEDSENCFRISLHLLRPDEWTTRVTLPKTAEAELAIRRLQCFKPAAGQKISCEYGGETFEIAADENGMPIVGKITVTDRDTVLTLKK